MNEYTTRVLHVISILLLTSAAISDVRGYRVKRIAGGEDAELTEFPYQVSLRYEGLHICGGALISETHVLSAAHCVCGILDEPYEELTIVTGTNSIGKGGDIHRVKSVNCHPEYVFGLERSWTHDLVLITLSANVSINEVQAPIALSTSEIIDNTPAVITGWGRSNPRGYLHKKLQKLSVTILPNENCQKYHNNTVLPSQICTYSGKGSGACMGDSGGPLVSNDTLIGIFSWTKPCALGSPDVFSRIHYFIDFIENSMKNDTNINPVGIKSRNSANEDLTDQYVNLVSVKILNSTDDAKDNYTDYSVYALR